MPRKARPMTAEVTLRFRVPKGATATQVKRLFENTHKDQLDIDPEWDEAEVFGDRTIKPKVVAAKVYQAAKRPTRWVDVGSPADTSMAEMALVLSGHDPADYKVKV